MLTLKAPQSDGRQKKVLPTKLALKHYVKLEQAIFSCLKYLYVFCRLRPPKPRVAGSIPAGRANNK